MPTQRDFQSAMHQVRDLLTSDQPASVSDYLMVPKEGQPYIRGSSVSSLEMRTVLTKSGLHVPITAKLGPDPIDLLKTYVTASEAFGRSMGMPHVLRWLAEADRDSVLRDVAGVLAERQAIAANWNECDRGLVQRLFREDVAAKILNLLGHDRPLVSPQGLLILAKGALQLSPVGGNTDMSMLVPAVLAIQEDLGTRDRAQPDDEADRLTSGGRLFREVLRSQAFHSQRYEGTVMPQFDLRWRELPRAMAGERGALDLEAVFAEATGVGLDDFTALGLGLWARAAEQPGQPIPLAYFASFHWADERLERTLQMIARVPGELSGALTEHEEEFGYQWSFDPIRRFPVVRLDHDRVLIISPRLLFERVFGWLPIFDVVRALEADGQQRRGKQVESFFRRVCERQAMDALRAIAGNGPAKRLYDEADLQRAFGRGRTADAVLDYGSTWVVVEISSRQLVRESVIGGSREHLETDLARGIYTKAEQLHATITQLADDESRLTGVATVLGRRFVPLLITTEGFPINPMTTTVIEADLVAKGLLAGPLVAPIRIIDQEELYVIEAIVEDGDAGLLDLLDGYNAGRLRGMGFKDWASAERGLELGRPARLEDAFHHAFRPALAALGEAEGDRSA
jgi:hypothetical protein